MSQKGVNELGYHNDSSDVGLFQANN